MKNQSSANAKMLQLTLFPEVKKTFVEVYATNMKNRLEMCDSQLYVINDYTGRIGTFLRVSTLQRNALLTHVATRKNTSNLEIDVAADVFCETFAWKATPPTAQDLDFLISRISETYIESRLDIAKLMPAFDKEGVVFLVEPHSDDERNYFQKTFNKKATAVFLK